MQSADEAKLLFYGQTLIFCFGTSKMRCEDKQTLDSLKANKNSPQSVMFRTLRPFCRKAIKEWQKFW